jgi:hypothetical protein
VGETSGIVGLATPDHGAEWLVNQSPFGSEKESRNSGAVAL